MSIRARHAHFTNWAKVCEGINQKETLVSDEASARTFLETTSDGEVNPFYYMVCFIKDTQEIYTHGKFYSFKEVKDLIAALSEDVQNNELAIGSLDERITSLATEVAENEEVAAKAYSDLNLQKADKGEIPKKTSQLENDSAFVALDYVNSEISLKQDLLVSGTNIKTLNGVSLLGSGELSAAPQIHQNIQSGSVAVFETLTAPFTYITIPHTTGDITLIINARKGLNNNFEHEWHIFINVTSISHSFNLTNSYSYPIIWTNGAVPVFDNGNMYEIHIKHIPGVNKLFAICASYPLS